MQPHDRAVTEGSKDLHPVRLSWAEARAEEFLRDVLGVERPARDVREARLDQLLLELT